MFAFKKKILWLVLACTLVTALIVGLISIIAATDIVRSNAEERLRLQCERTAADLNSILGSIKREVNVNYWIVRDRILSERDILRDAARLQTATESIMEQVAARSQYMPGCIAAYVRYIPEFRAEGFFLTLNRQGRMTRQEPTDVSRYAPDDVGHVGWYYEPLKLESPGQGIWIGPYYNENIGRMIISYVRPLDIDGRRIGVIGLDIEQEYFTEFVHDLEIYDTGYAFSTSDGKLRVHRDYRPGTELAAQPELADFLRATEGDSGVYTLGGVQKRFARTVLADGSELYLCAPAREIYADSDKLIKTLLAVILISVAIVSIGMNLVLDRFMKLATTDALTKLANRERFAEFFRTAQESDKPYAFFILDADKFKRINDTFGHDQGDRVLRRIAKALQGIEEGGIVARWGGDEFIGLLPLGDARARLARLCVEITGVKDSVYGRISVSIGACRADKGLTQDEVTKVADVALYESKQQEGVCFVTWAEPETRKS